MPPTMAFTLVKGSILLVLHTKENPSDDVFEEYIKFAGDNIHRIKSTMILTEGGGPNAMQRGLSNDLLETHNIKAKIAVVTLSRAIRGIVTALSWFNPNIKAFSTIQIPAAMEYLEVPREDRDAVVREVKALRKKLDLPVD